MWNHARRLRRRGVTLLEVLLVLALLVIISTTAWPALEPSLTSYQLRKSAEQVRVAWNRARIESLSSGQTIRFRFVPGDRTYTVERAVELLQRALADEHVDRLAAGQQLVHQELTDEAGRAGHEVSHPWSPLILSDYLRDRTYSGQRGVVPALDKMRVRPAGFGQATGGGMTSRNRAVTAGAGIDALRRRATQVGFRPAA
mgnify:CR=1 FL=1